ncbi:MAG: 1,5-anhydro-D-fructose reductase [Alphaproteobacteria bacterium MarineAlpha10_Bin2]|nr:MAG: 1,5-anhydro-D-fructose reductase [Alphaproteobacteria bacterium MarineAlpha10_Bin2]
MAAVRWGILSSSSFAVEHIIPALKQCHGLELCAVSSRNGDTAQALAAKFGIARAHGSYQALVDDPEIDVVYNPLTNDLHVPWSIKALEAGKHVLCEKPLAMNAAEAEQLIAARDKAGLLVQEAFVIRHHPQWRRVRELVREGRIGTLKAAQGWLSYRLEDADNFRNRPEMGGGGLMDIGVYPMVTSRYIFEDEPMRVFAAVRRDADTGVDCLVSAILDFPAGQAGFTCSTELAVQQHMAFFGSHGRIELSDPFAQAPDRVARILIGGDRGIWDPAVEEYETFEPLNMYVNQAEEFSAAVRGGKLEIPLEDGLANMRILDALFRSGKSGAWEAVA